MTGLPETAAARREGPMSLLHAVLLSFDPELSDEEGAELVRQVRSWPEEIGGFEHLAVGAPISSERTRGYQFLLHIVVPDEEVLTRYQTHPVHQSFARWVTDRGGLVLAFDYVLDRETVVVEPPAAPGDAASQGDQTRDGEDVGIGRDGAGAGT